MATPAAVIKPAKVPIRGKSGVNAPITLTIDDCIAVNGPINSTPLATSSAIFKSFNTRTKDLNLVTTPPINEIALLVTQIPRKPLTAFVIASIRSGWSTRERKALLILSRMSPTDSEFTNSITISFQDALIESIFLLRFSIARAFSSSAELSESRAILWASCTCVKLERAAAKF